MGTSLLGAFSNDHRPCGTAVYQHLRRLAAQAQASKKTASSDQLPLKTGRQRLVVLGSGWAAARLLHDIDPNLYDLTVRGRLRTGLGWGSWGGGARGLVPGAKTDRGIRGDIP